MDEKIYKIGDYEFETLREYRQAQEDLKKIKYITDELDIYDPEVAIRLYTMMRTKKIRFKSEIAISFYLAEGGRHRMHHCCDSLYRILCDFGICGL